MQDMPVETTLSIIKPDAVAACHTGSILACLEEAGFEIAALKMTRLTKGQARAFYAVHSQRPFYGSLVAFMTSGPVVAVLLRRGGAIAGLRAVMGATNPSEAAPGTIRARFGTNIEKNAIHGSDSPATAAVESAYFFNALERVVG